MSTTKQKPVVKKTWTENGAAKYGQCLSIYTHAPWISSTITGILGFYYTSMENSGLTGIMILPIFIYFNIIHFAKFYLNYNQTIALTLMSLFPTLVIVVKVVPQFNPDIMGYLLTFYSLSSMFCGIFVMSCGTLREKQLKERFWADKKLKQLTHHEEMFTIWCALSLGAANFAAMIAGFYYLKVFVFPVSFVHNNDVVREPPGADFHIFMSIFISIFGFLALLFGKKTVCHFLKICKLKAAKTSVKNTGLNV